MSDFNSRRIPLPENVDSTVASKLSSKDYSLSHSNKDLVDRLLANFYSSGLLLKEVESNDFKAIDNDFFDNVALSGQYEKHLRPEEDKEALYNELNFIKENRVESENPFIDELTLSEYKEF